MTGAAREDGNGPIDHRGWTGLDGGSEADWGMPRRQSS